MSLEFNADRQEVRASNLKISSSDDLTFRSGGGNDEKEVLRVLIDPVSKLPRIGVNRTGRRLQSITVLTAGSGYATPPSVLIDPPDDLTNGVQATATALILGGSLLGISINNVGFGYSIPPSITISGGGGSGATAEAILDTVDYELDVNGAIRTSTSIISDTARILNLDIENFVTPDINFRAPDLKIYANNAGSLWEPNTTYQINTILYFGDNLYRVENNGISGTSAPLFKDGSAQNGQILLKHVGFRVNDDEKPFYEQTIYPRSVTPPLGDKSDKIATTEYVLNLATNDVGGRVYVSQEIGNDANNGRSAAAPVRTIKRACQIASATIGVKETVIISGGDYVEDNPISIPPDCSIVGDNLRLVIVRPGNPRKHMFKFADKNYITGIVFRDQLDAEQKPVSTWDFAVAFDDKQRLYYDPSVGGDFLRNFPIGHQIFGKLKFRVFFQDHTGIQVTGGNPTGSFLTIGAQVIGVNTGATGIVTAISYDETSGNDAYESGTFDVEVTGGSFAIGETFEYDVGTPPTAITYSMVSNDIVSIRAEGEVVYHGTQASSPLSITRVDGSLQGTFTGGFGGDDDLGGLVFYTNPLIGAQNIHDFKEGQEIVISGLTGNLSVCNGIQRIYKVIEDADGRSRRFVIPKKLPSFTDSNYIPPGNVTVVSRSYYILVSLLNSPNKFESTAFVGRRWQDATNLIRNSIEFIKDETYLKVTDEFNGINYTTFTQPNPDKCRRDIGHFVNAICNDLQFGSNFNVIEAAKRYVAGTQIGYIGNEITETVRAFEIAKDLCKLAVRNWHTGNGAYSQPLYTAEYSQLSYYVDSTVIEDTTPPTCDDVVSAVDTLGYLFVNVITNNADNRYLDASELIARNEELIIEEVIGEVSTAYPDFYYPDTDPDGYRFKDSRNLIYSNLEEIKDRAIAKIAVSHPDFYFPGDTQTTQYSRFYDAYRLIQQNIKEIKDRALAEISVQYTEAGWGTDWIIPGDTITQARARFYDAYRLIQKNRNILVETAYATVVASPPSPAPTDLLAKCKRDIGYFIDAVSLDVFLGGNEYSRKFIQQYFNNGSPISNGLVGEETQSVTAFNKARDAMAAAVTNTLGSFSGVVTSSPAGGTWVDGSTGSKTVYTDLTISSGPATNGGGGANIANNSSSACADVRSAITTLSGIITDRITAGNLSGLPTETLGSLYSGSSKCWRDIGYFVDAISLDLFVSSNKYSRQFILQYFDNGTPISNGLVGETAQSVVAFNMARDMMKKAVTNQLYVKDLTISDGPATYGGGGGDIPVLQSGNAAACADVQSAITTLSGIITDRISAGNLTGLPAETAPVYQTGQAKCRRDVGYIIKAVANDLYNGGNSNIILATKYYFDSSGTPISNGLVGETAESVTAFTAARDAMKLAVSNQLYVKDLTLTADPVTGSNTDINSCANVHSAIDTLVGIINYAISNSTLSNLPTVNTGIYLTGENVCKRDIGYILSALRRDITLGGNAGIVSAGEAYFSGAVLTGISQAELPVTRFAFEKVRDLAILAARNWHTGNGAYSQSLYEPKYSIIPLYTDSTVTEDTTPPTCDNVVSSITSSFTTLDDILDGGTIPSKTYGTLYNTDGIINIPDNTVYDANNNYTNLLSVYDDLPIIEASPYIQNASVISFLGGGGAEIDGKKVKQPNCPFPGLEPDGNASYPNQGKSMVAAQFTIITFNGTGYLIKNDGYTQLVSVFVLFARDGVLADTGGYASITNSATNFGIYALRAIGYREEPYVFDIGTIVSTNITPNGSTILRIGGLGREPLEHYIVKFADYENQDPDIEYYIDGVSNVSVGPPFTASCALNAPILIKRKSNGTNVGVVDDAEMVGKEVRLHRPSIVNSSSHTWEFAGSGTDYNALPENGGTKIDAYEQVSEAYGRVYTSGTDELGDFKVGSFAKIENRTGNITFTGTVSISEVEFLKLKGGDVVVTGFSAANNLGGAFASDSLIATQKAIRDYIGNNLGPYLNKPYSTNAVPRALVELTDSGKISLDQIPALRPFSVFTVDDLAARLALEGPLAGDIAIQTDTNTSFILNNDLTSLYLGIPVDNSYTFTVGSLVTGDLTNGILQVTEYRKGVVYEIQITDSGSGYTSAPTVTIGAPGTGVSATAVATIANGEVVTVTITFNNGYIGGYGYTTAPTISFSAPGAGGTTAAANALIESRVYGDIVNRIKISDTDSVLDHSGTPISINVTRVVNTSASDADNWVSLSSSSVSAQDITSGVISTSRLAQNSAEANSFTFLAGDQTYKPVTQTIKAQERRYFLKTVSTSTTPSTSLVVAPDSRLLIGHEVFGNGIAENTTISQLVTTEGTTSITLSSPITQTISSGSIISFRRPESVVLFEASFVKTNYIDVIIIQSGGSGYTNGQYFGVPLTGGTGTGLTANIVVSSGEVTSITVADGGVNYTEDFVVDDEPIVLGAGVGLVLLAKLAGSTKNAGVIGMDIKRVDDKTLNADPYGNAGVARFLKSDTPLGRIGQFRFAAGGGVYIDQGPDSGFDADKLDGQQGNYYLNGANFLDASISPSKLTSGTYNIDISGQSGNTLRLTTQTGNPNNSGLPNVSNVGITSDWRANTADGLVDTFRPDDPDSGYHGVITFRQFGSANDQTGGGVRQLGFTDKNNLWIRGSGAGVAVWSDWRVVWTSGNDGVGSGLDADRLDGKQGLFYQNAQNINTGKFGAYHLPELFDTTKILTNLSIQSYDGNPFYNVYISGKALTTFPFQVNQTVNLYDSNLQGVGTVYISNVTANGTSADSTDHYTILEVRLDNGGFTNALRIGTASINEIFHDYTPSTQTSREYASITSSGGVGRLRLGSLTSASSPSVDFNSSGNNITYDVRLQATGGSATNGNGELNVIVANTNSLKVNNNIVWNAGNVTFNSGINAGAYDTAANGTAVLRDSTGNFAANFITASLIGAASLNVLKSGDTMSGDLTVGSVTRASSSFVRVLSNDANSAGFEAYGNNQGTGYLYIGQSNAYGGGLSYNGDGSPAFATGEVADNIAFYRTDNGTKTVVFQYPYNSNTVSFRGAISTGEAIFDGGTNNNTNDATVYITATNNNDWGLIVDKYNGSSTEYGIQIDVGSSATYALRVRGNDSETFRVGGNGNIVGTGLALGTTGDITTVRNITLSGNISLTANSTRIQQTSTSSWSGDAGNGFGKLEYHSNRWYINAGADSTEILRIRRGGTDQVVIDNSGNTSFGTSSTATITAGLLRLGAGASDGIQITGTAPTITFRDTDHRTGYIHINSNIFYVLGGAINANPGAWSQVANSRWPLQIDLTNNNAQFGGDIDANTGNIFARSFRTPGASFGSGSVGSDANNNNYVLYANGDRQWLDSFGVVKANRQSIGENLTIPTSLNACSYGPITINNGVTVYIGNGGTWTVV
jgi:hypothetical protein